MNFKSLLTIAFVMLTLLGSQAVFAQGTTTAAMNGRVTDSNGEAVPGATILAIHTPTGAQFGNVTDVQGYYRISNMTVGGPYSVTVSFVGFEDVIQENVYLTLGQTFRFNATLEETVTELDEVVVIAESGEVFDGNRTGAQTVVGERRINEIPAASRSVADFVRLTPQAQISEGSDGFSISLAGQNNRYNAIYIDGAVNNDVFGLAGSGTNGGQTGVNPFAVDAIEEFQVALAPFDVRISGFTGGAINAVTRSGTNNFEGSAYYFVRNQDLAGKTPKGLRVDGDSEKLDEFSAKTYGFRLGGPIVKDKLFFFVNYERQDDEIPQPFDVANYTGDTDAAGLSALESFVSSTYGYDMGQFANTNRTLESDKITAKFDWNISQNNRLSFKHSYVGAENLEARSSGINNIGYLNGSEFFDTKTNSSSLEWSLGIGNNMSNNLKVGYTIVRDDRSPLGSPFPTIFIADGKSNNAADGEGISFGAEPFSTANLLDQDILTITNNFEVYKGKHTLTFGAHAEYSKVKNLFFAFNYGEYQYSTVDDFINNTTTAMTPTFPRIFERGYSLLGSNDVVGDASAGAAEFNVFQLGLYVQDEIAVNDELTLTAGVRVDFPFWEDGIVNDDFNTRTIPLLEAEGKDLQGATVGPGIDTKLHFSPRIGFNYNVNAENNTQLRGGIGIFTSRVPLVWPGGAYNNNGVTGGFLFRFAPNDIFFEPDVTQQPFGAEPGTGEVGGNVDLFASDFKLPQVMKLNLAVDQKLPFWGLVASVDLIYNKNLNAVYYENLNVREPVGNLLGPDGRPRYNRSDEIDDTYGRIILGSNTSEGYTWNGTVSVTKPFSNGFEAQVAYSYGDGEVLFEGTSSQNSSQWRNIQTVNGKNSALPLARTDFALGSRITAYVSYTKTWNENLATTLGLFYDGTSGSPYSYIYREGSDLLNDDSRDNALIYVPRDQSEINLVDTDITAAEQWAALDAFIESDDYLSERRGQYAERNGDRGPWQNSLDLKFIQEVGVGKNRLQFSLDIFNFLNLISEDWGQREFYSRNVALIETEGVADNGDGTFTPSFSFDPSTIDNIEQVSDSGLRSSRWQMQLGVRYIFK